MKPFIPMLAVIAVGGVVVGAGLVAFTGGDGARQPAPPPAELRATIPPEMAPTEGNAAVAAQAAGSIVETVSLTEAERVAAAAKLLGSSQSGQDDIKAAISTLEEAANNDVIEALRVLGRTYRQGKVVPGDPRRAMEYEIRLADLGDSDAARSVGFAYARGKDVEADSSLAIRYLERAVAADEHAGSLKLLGDIHRQEGSPHHSPEKATNYYRRAADKDDPWALLALADLTRESAVDGSRDGEALQLYEKALALGNNAALRAIGNLYHRTASDLRDVGKAADYLMRAARDGDTRALLDLAKLHTGRDLGGSDPADVIAMLEAAEMGKNAAYALKLRGDLHQIPGARRNLADAVKSYRKAGELGDGWAMIAWGDLVRAGRTPAAEPLESIYLKAAELGAARAYVRLGDLSWRKKTKTARAAALDFYGKAEAMGDTMANLRIARANQEQYRQSDLLADTISRYRKAASEVGVAETAKHMFEGDKNGLVAAVQQLLISAGHDIGTADGVMGRKTAVEMEKFCKVNEIAKCKQITKDLIAALLTHS